MKQARIAAQVLQCKPPRDIGASKHNARASPGPVAGPGAGARTR
jgi:hypothetical protein